MFGDKISLGILKAGGIAGAGLVVFLILGFAVTNNLILGATALSDPSLRYHVGLTIIILAFGTSIIFCLLWILQNEFQKTSEKKQGNPSYVLIGACIFCIIFVFMFCLIAPTVIFSYTQKVVAAIPVPAPTPTPTPTPAPTPSPNPTAQNPPVASSSPKEKTSNFTVCIGQFASRCASSDVVLPCGAFIESWAANKCQRISVTKLSDVPGNACGYYRASVECTNIIP